MNVEQVSFRLRYFLNKKGISVKELAKKSNISLCTIKSILEKKHKNIRFITLISILNALNIDFLDFLNVPFSDYVDNIIVLKVRETEKTDLFF